METEQDLRLTNALALEAASPVDVRDVPLRIRVMHTQAPSLSARFWSAAARVAKMRRCQSAPPRLEEPGNWIPVPPTAADWLRDAPVSLSAGAGGGIRTTTSGRC